MVMKRGSTVFKVTASCAIVTFAAVFLLSDALRAKENFAATMGLPEPAKILKPSGAYDLPVLKGLKVDVNNPLNLEFIIDGGDKANVNKRDVAMLTNYFLAGVTMPGEDLWVNLSPYETDRIVSDQLAQTDLGKDMLAQDYVLKQFMSSMTAPTEKAGKSFWQETLEKVAAEIGTTNVPVNTFNKVWIVPGSAEVAEDGTLAVIADAKLKVMLDQDYLALNKANTNAAGAKDDIAKVNKITEDVVREKILPLIEKEVNEGKNFAQIRQMYHALILSTWFRQKMLNSFYKHYMNTSKSAGIETSEKDAKAKIYKLYNDAFKRGVYDFMAKEKDIGTGSAINRHYFSGGEKVTPAEVSSALTMSEGAAEVSSALKKVVRAVVAVVLLTVGAENANAQKSALLQSTDTVTVQMTPAKQTPTLKNASLDPAIKDLFLPTVVADSTGKTVSINGVSAETIRDAMRALSKNAPAGAKRDDSALERAGLLVTRLVAQQYDPRGFWASLVPGVGAYDAFREANSLREGESVQILRPEAVGYLNELGFSADDFLPEQLPGTVEFNAFLRRARTQLSPAAQGVIAGTQRVDAARYSQEELAAAVKVLFSPSFWNADHAMSAGSAYVAAFRQSQNKAANILIESGIVVVKPAVTAAQKKIGLTAGKNVVVLVPTKTSGSAVLSTEKDGLTAGESKISTMWTYGDWVNEKFKRTWLAKGLSIKVVPLSGGKVSVEISENGQERVEWTVDGNDSYVVKQIKKINDTAKVFAGTKDRDPIYPDHGYVESYVRAIGQYLREEKNKAAADAEGKEYHANVDVNIGDTVKGGPGTDGRGYYGVNISVNGTPHALGLYVDNLTTDVLLQPAVRKAISEVVRHDLSTGKINTADYDEVVGYVKKIADVARNVAKAGREVNVENIRTDASFPKTADSQRAPSASSGIVFKAAVGYGLHHSASSRKDSMIDSFGPLALALVMPAAAGIVATVLFFPVVSLSVLGTLAVAGGAWYAYRARFGQGAASDYFYGKESLASDRLFRYMLKKGMIKDFYDSRNSSEDARLRFFAWAVGVQKDRKKALDTFRNMPGDWKMMRDLSVLAEKGLLSADDLMYIGARRLAATVMAATADGRAEMARLLDNGVFAPRDVEDALHTRSQLPVHDVVIGKDRIARVVAKELSLTDMDLYRFDHQAEGAAVFEGDKVRIKSMFDAIVGDTSITEKERIAVIMNLFYAAEQVSGYQWVKEKFGDYRAATDPLYDQALRQLGTSLSQAEKDIGRLEAHRIVFESKQVSSTIIAKFIGKWLQRLGGSQVITTADVQALGDVGLSKDDLNVLLDLMKFHHADQTRKDNVTSYLVHTFGVAAIMMKLTPATELADAKEAVIAAFLHDAIEDSIWYYKDGVRTKDGKKITPAKVASVKRNLRVYLARIPDIDADRVLAYVNAMTKQNGSDLMTTYFPTLVETGTIAVRLKLADRIYNLSDRSAGVEFSKKYLRETLKEFVYAPITAKGQTQPFIEFASKELRDDFDKTLEATAAWVGISLSGMRADVQAEVAAEAEAARKKSERAVKSVKEVKQRFAESYFKNPKAYNVVPVSQVLFDQISDEQRAAIRGVFDWNVIVNAQYGKDGVAQIKVPTDRGELQSAPGAKAPGVIEVARRIVDGETKYIMSKADLIAVINALSLELSDGTKDTAWDALVFAGTKNGKGVPAAGKVARRKDSDALGGIDFNDIKVSASPLTKAMEFAPFDINTFKGFSFTVVSLKKATQGDLAAMVG